MTNYIKLKFMYLSEYAQKGISPKVCIIWFDCGRFVQTVAPPIAFLFADLKRFWVHSWINTEVMSNKLREIGRNKLISNSDSYHSNRKTSMVS